jgi:hypothetical protein
MTFSKLMSMASAHAEARIVQVAVELGIFDCLVAGPLGAAEIASELDLDERGTELLVNALVALRLLRKHGESYVLSAIAKTYLVNGSPTAVCGMIRFESARWGDWARLAEAVRLGKPSRESDMYQGKSEETEAFVTAMDSLVKARGDAEILAQRLDFHNVTKLLDIGSGPATYPICFCRRWPMLRATVFDLPGTLALTHGYVRGAGLQERFTLIPGDYRRDEIPGRYQIIFLSNIIHGEGVEENRKLIAKLAAALEPQGRIIIKDHILELNGSEPPVGAIFSLLMLLTTEAGRCYALDEVTDWLKSAGLQKITKLDLPPPLTSSLVIAER